LKRAGIESEMATSEAGTLTKWRRRSGRWLHDMDRQAKTLMSQTRIDQKKEWIINEDGTTERRFWTLYARLSLNYLLAAKRVEERTTAINKRGQGRSIRRRSSRTGMGSNNSTIITGCWWKVHDEAISDPMEVASTLMKFCRK